MLRASKGVSGSIQFATANGIIAKHSIVAPFIVFMLNACKEIGVARWEAVKKTNDERVGPMIRYRRRFSSTFVILIKMKRVDRFFLPRTLVTLGLNFADLDVGTPLQLYN